MLSNGVDNSMNNDAFNNRLIDRSFVQDGAAAFDHVKPPVVCMLRVEPRVVDENAHSSSPRGQFTHAQTHMHFFHSHRMEGHDLAKIQKERGGGTESVSLSLSLYLCVCVFV